MRDVRLGPRGRAGCARARRCAVIVLCDVFGAFSAMFSLFGGLYTYATQRHEYFILILGLDNAGKTVSCDCFLNEQFKNSNTTRRLPNNFAFN